MAVITVVKKLNTDFVSFSTSEIVCRKTEALER